MNEQRHNVFRLARRLGLNITSFCKLVDVKRGTLFAIRNGRHREMSNLLAQRIADKLGIDPKFLVQNDPAEPVPEMGSAVFELAGKLAGPGEIAGPPEPPAETDGGVWPDAELNAMESMAVLIRTFDDAARARILAWLNSKYGGPSYSQNGLKK